MASAASVDASPGGALRIAVVQVGFPVQGYTRDLINGLAAQGCSVDLLTDRRDLAGYIDPTSITGTVLCLDASPPLVFCRRLRARLAMAAGWSIRSHPAGVHAAARKCLAARPRYDLLIGVEKGGLEIATGLGRAAATPVVYYSLELYLPGHPGWRRFGWQRASEIACHRLAAATIIQDRFRWEALRSANAPVGDRVFYLPVGVAGAPTEATPKAVDAPATVLYFGKISRTRYSGELLGLASALPRDVTLHLHGPLGDRDDRSLLDAAPPPGVRISTELLPEAEIGELVAGADIGLALYHRDYANDRLTAYSSQKIAMYLRAAVPIIAFRSESYEDLMARYRCGELIDSIAELPRAIARIRAAPTAYRAAAGAAYRDVYRLDAYWPALVGFLAATARR